MEIDKITLPKTDFVAYIDAPMHLWAIKHNKLDKQEIDTYPQHLFEQGYDVEKHAEQYIKKHLVNKYRAGRRVCYYSLLM